MRASPDIWFSHAVKTARGAASDLQPWPGYFESKERELRMVSGFFYADNPLSVLEIGCGNGFSSCLLAGISKHVTAFDLPHKDRAHHSIGIDAARKLVKVMGLDNVGVVGGSAEDLPFDDGSFDVVFSEYMLQYVSDKARALGEMRRVLKKNGLIVAVLPNFVARLYAPLIHYAYIMGRIVYYASRKAARQDVPAGQGPFTAHTDKRGPRHLADIIFLRSDGAYKSFSEELVRHMPMAWKRLFERSGLKVTSTFSTEVIPLVLFDLCGPVASGFMAKKLCGLNERLGRMPVLKRCGYSFGVIAQVGRR